MIAVPGSVMSAYLSTLRLREIPDALTAHYQKWLRYYYDFSAKLPDLNSNPEQLKNLFLEKLRSKQQTELQCRQAAHAVALYNAQLKRVPVADTNVQKQGSDIFEAAQPTVSSAFRKQPTMYNPAGYQEKSASPEWDALLEVMAGEIKIRHYSRRTLKTYAN